MRCDQHHVIAVFAVFLAYAWIKMLFEVHLKWLLMPGGIVVLSLHLHTKIAYRQEQ